MDNKYLGIAIMWIGNVSKGHCADLIRVWTKTVIVKINNKWIQNISTK